MPRPFVVKARCQRRKSTELWRSLVQLGLVEIQPTRPKLYSALPSDEVVDRLLEISHDNAEQFARRALDLRATLAALPEQVRGRKTFADLALGVESHVKRHIIYLATAQQRIWSYLEHGDLTALKQVTAGGFPILRRIARNSVERRLDQRMVFWVRLSNRSSARQFSAQASRSLGTSDQRPIFLRDRPSIPCHRRRYRHIESGSSVHSRGTICFTSSQGQGVSA